MAAITTINTQAAEVSGSVLNQGTQKYLERAVVVVKDTAFQTLTDTDGKFRITGLPEGTYSLVVSYSGLDDATSTVTVKEGEPAVVEVAMTAEEVYTLGEVVVTGAREGVSYAVNQQRRAESARTVTSIDAFIDQSTGNPGEFLKNVEGIQMDYSQNEPQAIRVRGIDPNLTSVTMDGNEIASAASSSASRAVQVDQLSIAAIESVEVFKAPVPWMSANAIGGAVNFNTKSAFDQKGQRAFAQIGVNMDSHDFGRKSNGPGHGEKAENRIYPAGRVEYSNSFFDNRLGVLFSVGYDHTNQLGSSTTQEVRRVDIAGVTPASQTGIPFSLENSNFRRANLAIAPNRQLRRRADINLNLDYKLSDSVVIYLKSTLSDYKSTNRNHGWNLQPGNGAFTGSTPFSYNMTSNGTATQTTSLFDKYTKTWQFNSGIKYKSGDWKAELAGGFSKSINHYKNPDNFGMLSTTLGNIRWATTSRLDHSTPLAIVQTQGPDFYDLNNYAPSQGNLTNGLGVTAGVGNIPDVSHHRASHGGLVNTNKRDTDNTKYTGRLDVRRDFALSSVNFNIRTGLAYTENIYDKRQDQKRYYWLGDDGRVSADDYTSASNLGRFAETTPVTQQIPGWTLREPTYLDQNLLWKYWQLNPQVFQENMAYSEEQRIRGRQKVNEQVTAAYLAAEVFVGKFQIIPGVRIENTDITAEGVRTMPGTFVDSIDGVRARFVPEVSDASYDSDPFKYLHVKYEVTSDFQVRASYTDAIGRPNLNQVIPSNTDDGSGNYDINEAGLEPQYSKNLDLSLEYYTKSSGQWTFGWFSRDIKDFIQRTTEPPTAEQQALRPDSRMITTWRNLGYAKWQGIEFKFSQDLREWAFVPKALSGITIWGNYTNNYNMDGEIDSRQGIKIKKLGNTVPEYYNAGIRYNSPRRKFSAHLKWNFQREKPTTNVPIVLTSAEYEALPVATQAAYRSAQASAQRESEQEDYQFFDLELSYKLTKKLSLTAVGRNLLSEQQVFTENGIVRQNNQYTGIAWTFAAKYDL